MILDLGILAVTLLMMVTVGTELEARDFPKLARQKGAILGTLVLPTIVLPVLGFALACCLSLPSHLTAGLLLLAACPVGDIANFYTLLAHGNIPLSVSVNTLSCLLSAGTMALAFALYDHLLDQKVGFALPTPALVLRLALLVALPVLAGMALRRWKASWTGAHRVTLRKLCFAGIALLLAYVLTSRWAQVVDGWRQTTLTSLLFMVSALALGLASARLLRLNPSDSLTVGLLFAVRNVALASAIAITLLNRIDFAEMAAVYILVEVPLLLCVVGAYRRWWSPVLRPSQSVSAQT
jgi:bile acid:Na+ symporter, BASS family